MKLSPNTSLPWVDLSPKIQGEITTLRIREKRRTKLLALILCLSLATVVAADVVSRYLVVDIAVSDAEYSVEWVSAAPETLSVLETYYGELVFSTTLTPTETYNFNVIFEIVSMPSGASFSDVSFGLQVGDFPVFIEVMTGLTMSYGRFIPSGVSFINHDIELYIGYPGNWQFQIFMEIP